MVIKKGDHPNAKASKMWTVMIALSYSLGRFLNKNRTVGIFFFFAGSELILNWALNAISTNQIVQFASQAQLGIN